MTSAPALSSSSDIEATATDYRGAAQELLQLPRRPSLKLEHSAGFAADAEAYVLFPGPPEADWADDLARAPLRAEHAERCLALEAHHSDDTLVLSPREALMGGADFTLGIAAWARSRRGTPLTRDGGARLIALHTAEGIDAGARVRSAWPFDAATEVPPRLAAAVLAFDGRIEGALEGVWLEDAAGLAIAAEIDDGPCSELAPEHADAYCVRLRPEQPLARNRVHRIVVGSGANDAHGAPLGPFQSEFRTAANEDSTAPVLRAPTCAIDEVALQVGCALTDDSSLQLRSVADEPAIVSLRAQDKQRIITTPAGEFTLKLEDLASDAPLDVELSAADGATNQVLHRATLRTLPPLPTISISEVLADPLGPEPQQEWLELLNYGARSVELGGLSLSDRLDAGGEAFPAGPRLPPGARALVVSTQYDPSQLADPAPAKGVMLIRVGKTLTRTGLGNAGEALYLRDLSGRRLSAAPGTPRPRAGVCAVRVADRMRDGSDGAFAYASECSPGR